MCVCAVARKKYRMTWLLNSFFIIIILSIIDQFLLIKNKIKLCTFWIYKYKWWPNGEKKKRSIKFIFKIEKKIFMSFESLSWSLIFDDDDHHHHVQHWMNWFVLNKSIMSICERKNFSDEFHHFFLLSYWWWWWSCFFRKNWLFFLSGWLPDFVFFFTIIKCWWWWSTTMAKWLFIHSLNDHLKIIWFIAL